MQGEFLEQPRPAARPGEQLVEAWMPARSGGAPEALDGAGPSAGLGALARIYLPDNHVLWPGNRCQLLRDGVEAYPAMLEAIRRARRSVRLETYMFIDDSVGELFARALIEAAERGVRVKVLYDAVGSMSSKVVFFQKMRAGGVDIHAFKPFSLARGLGRLIRRDHRKILVVDGEFAFIGGINISANWAPKGQGDNWRDDVLQIEGPAVHQLERCFKASWRLQLAKRARERRSFRKRARTTGLVLRGATSLAVLSSRRTIFRAYLHAIGRARKSVLIAAAYFIPDRRMVAALRDAAARGVEVSIILNRKGDHPILQWATRAFYDRLMRSGVKIYEWKEGVLHAKTAVIDGVWGTIGSFNLERTSLWLNHEVNAAFADPTLAVALEESFRRDCGFCTPILPAEWSRRPFWQKALERIFYVFRKIL